MLKIIWKEKSSQQTFQNARREASLKMRIFGEYAAITYRDWIRCIRGHSHTRAYKRTVSVNFQILVGITYVIDGTNLNTLEKY